MADFFGTPDGIQSPVILARAQKGTKCDVALRVKYEETIKCGTPDGMIPMGRYANEPGLARPDGDFFPGQK